jgi:hypothetical protein
VVPPLDLPNGA